MILMYYVCTISTTYFEQFATEFKAPWKKLNECNVQCTYSDMRGGGRDIGFIVETLSTAERSLYGCESIYLSLSMLGWPIFQPRDLRQPARKQAGRARHTHTAARYPSIAWYLVMIPLALTGPPPTSRLTVTYSRAAFRGSWQRIFLLSPPLFSPPTDIHIQLSPHPPPSHYLETETASSYNFLN